MASYPVRLYRNSAYTAWGFRLQGGADLNTPILVQRVFAGSPAEGHLQRGDILVGIENYDATCLLHREAQDLVGSSGTSLSLNVKRTHGNAARLARGHSVGPMGWQQTPAQSTMPASGHHVNRQQQQHQYPQYQQPQQYQPQPQQYQPQPQQYQPQPQQYQPQPQQYQPQPQQYQPQPQQYQPQTQQYQPQPQQYQPATPTVRRQAEQYNVYVGRPSAAAGGQRQRSESSAQYDGWQYRQQKLQQQQQQQQRQNQHRDVAIDNFAAQANDQARRTYQPATTGQQRSIDDDEVDYSFTKQSVAERMRAFMRSQEQQQQRPNYPGAYHSVPRSGYAATAAASRFRQRRPGDPAYGTGPSALGDFGWSPSPEKLRWARRQDAPAAASRAAFEQSSYLPSRGIGRSDSPVRAGRSNSRSGAGVVGNGAGEHLAYNSRQYNTPINMYSKQNVANAFEGQIGATPTNQHHRAGREGTPGGQFPVAYNQSQVYKLVHEQENMQHGQKQQHQRNTSSSWEAMKRQESEIEEPGVSDF